MSAHPRPILGDALRVILGTDPPVERGVEPSETPPARVKKAWRNSGCAESSGASIDMPAVTVGPRAVFLSRCDSARPAP